ncbi:TetR/AcrR family transcriptional regulator [Amycolatopsis acidiphila]|uniref:TetR/AcrR family transcriptional regulator n=1 Tax=Amycolatopsis acidiphila TaxID=715473 RepID=A0A558AN16_9PSEU|nr:TetR/AcrR family transcriptional regulator [Amycolatopsis acidiphila]TVT25620.1 TetR/AcrR family transcriptional regulator [Amycolatopsis acidiphila]UIJ60375.1 TetR/AcrR family transcriptional regulator [Amycolatopsis acidiphila]GHG90485.1 TetR family transcriptional regulator [Amycolatopsis acidiphila]
MSKPTLRADARRNRARVLAAAQEAFADEGLAVPLDEIARRAGVGAGTVYRHFPSKESLFEAVVLDGVERLAEQARERLSEDDAGRAFFDFLEIVAEQALLNKALCEALESAGSGLSKRVEPATDFRARFGELLRRAQAAGAVRDDVEPGDLTGLLAGYLAIRRQSPANRSLSRILTDGLRRAT